MTNYFYNLASPPNWHHRNCFGRVFTGSEAVGVGGGASKRYHLCLKVIPMGDLNGVDIAHRGDASSFVGVNIQRKVHERRRCVNYGING